MWGKLHHEEFQNMCPSENVIRVIKSRTMRLTGQMYALGDEKRK
jgi:hypothetical protein